MAKTQIDAGGSGSGSYAADSGFTGGSTTTFPNTPITAGVLDPAPTTVYGTLRYDVTSFSRTITGLTVGQTYRFRVHNCYYAVNYAFQVKANSVVKATLSHVTPDDDNKVVVLDFTATPDGSGQIVLLFEKTSGSSANISALEYWQVTGGSAVPGDVSGFAGVAGLGATSALSWSEATDDLAIDHYRIQRDTVNTFNSGNLTTINTADYGLAYLDTPDPLTTYYYRIKAVDGDGNLSANWSSTVTVTTTAAQIQINCGGSATGSWIADQFYTNGTTSAITGTPDTTGLTNPAPTTVLASLRTLSGNGLNYHITGLKPNASHFVRVHIHDDNVPYSQIYKFNGARVSQATYPTVNKARIREFYVDSDAGGVLDMVGEVQAGGYSFLSGIEVIRQNPPTPFAGGINIVILGDSITEGFPYYDTSYPDLLAGLLTTNSYKFSSIIRYNAANHTSVYNLGIAGDALGGMSSRFTAEAASRIKADAVNIFMLLGGINDCFGGGSASGIETAIQTLCEDARTAGFDLVLAATMTKAVTVTGGNETTRANVNTWLRANYSSFADALVDFDGNAAFSDTAGANYSDGTHYSVAGYGVAAQMVYDVVTALSLTVPKTVHLAWSPSTDNVAVTGYKLRRATNSGFTTGVVDQTLGNVTQFDDDVTVTDDTTFYYKLLAFDAATNESAYCSPVNIPVTLF